MQPLRKYLRSVRRMMCLQSLKHPIARSWRCRVPNWLKWDLTKKPPVHTKYLICNADEGDPGAFMNLSVLESDPHSVSKE
jgi:NADH:ubiquinone oxidoreductase subunit F (NADH-binding)